MDTRVAKEEFLGYEVKCFRDKIIVLVGFVLFILPIGILTVLVCIGEFAERSRHTIGKFCWRIIKKFLTTEK